MNFLKRKSSGKPALLNNPTSVAFKELFRDLSVKLSLCLTGEGAKTLAITSTTQQDGQAAVAINLALTFASSGVRTLLIDVDLNANELTSLLQAQNCEAENVVSIQNNFDFVAFGRGKEFPYLNKQLAVLIQTYKNTYDYIIVNAPSALSVADMNVLAPVCDGFALVCKKYSSRVDNIQTALNILDCVKANVLGVIVNDNK